jgi:hypothetical protein
MNRSLHLVGWFALLAAGAVAAAGCSTSADGGAPDGSSPVSCDTLSSQAENALATASASAETDRSCSTDDDCLLLQGDPASCVPGCGQIVNTAGAALVQSAASSASVMTLCAQFSAQGCQVAQPPCAFAGPAAQCVAGACTAGYPAAWSTLAVESDTSGASLGFPLQCEGTSCTLWTVTPDATVTTQEPSGATKTATLTSADFATLDGILRDTTFRQAQLTQQLGCDAAVGSQHVTVEIDRPDAGGSTEDVSGCITGGPSGNDWDQIYDVLQNYP